ncbi:hypothetical protein DdX_05963 [Ditylenchus destructor]|uniref:Uncharacterized protein n=1 Tax=Ditylenchus destructor TaxID=166010 RepID=A0AAD4N8P0_9BILA|nr:hypothetical protein DdX_05963 [Ditylenchus destructor]
MESMAENKSCEVFLAFVGIGYFRKEQAWSFICRHFATAPMMSTSMGHEESDMPIMYPLVISPKIANEISSLSRLYKVLSSIAAQDLNQHAKSDVSNIFHPTPNILTTNCCGINAVIKYMALLLAKLRKLVKHFAFDLEYHPEMNMYWLEREYESGMLFTTDFKPIYDCLRTFLGLDMGFKRVSLGFRSMQHFGDSFALNSYDTESKSEDLHVTLNGGIDVFVLISFIIHKHRIAQEDGVVTNRLFLYTKGRNLITSDVTQFKSTALALLAIGYICKRNGK